MDYLKARLEKWIQQAITSLQAEAKLPAGVELRAEVEQPASPDHGDFAVSSALKWAKLVKQAPRTLATLLADRLRLNHAWVEKVDVAGPGFINLYLQSKVWAEEMDAIRKSEIANNIDNSVSSISNISIEKNRCPMNMYGRLERDLKRKLILEFVSANPTGPLNIVSGRAASVGDSLAWILRSQGVEVQTEYYINDAGKQTLLLGESIRNSYLQSRGKDIPIPKEGYHGDYIKVLMKKIVENNPFEIELLTNSKHCMTDLLNVFKNEGLKEIIESHKKDLCDFGVTFDSWFEEHILHTPTPQQVTELGIKSVDQVIEDLENMNVTYARDGATWFRSTEYGDDKDRVLVKRGEGNEDEGQNTYLAADIAYHLYKLKRGFNELVDIWGPDHHGYIARMKAAIEVFAKMSDEPIKFQVLIVQQVNLLEHGQPVAMSKRAGQFVTLADLVRDVGRDVARFFFLLRGTDGHLDFDLELARKHTEENPVFYVQYAHARICSIIKKAGEEGVGVPGPAEAVGPDLDMVPEERALLKELAAFPDVLRACAESFEPHGLAFYLRDVATAFHRFYTVCKVVDQNESSRTRGRLGLIQATKIILRNGLGLLGITTPEKM